MYQTRVWNDITTSVEYAVRDHIDVLTEEKLMQRSDALLATLPSASGSQYVTTAAFLRQHRAALHNEVCRGTQPRAIAATVTDQIHDLTRAVMVTGTAEGMSIEAAVGVALVLYKRGVVLFCAQPNPQDRAF